MSRIEIGDRFRHKGRAGSTYVAQSEYQWQGARRIVGWHQHAPNQKVGIDLPENELERVEVSAEMWRADGSAQA